MQFWKIFILLFLVGSFVFIAYLSQNNKHIIIQSKNAYFTDFDETIYLVDGRYINFYDGLSRISVDDKWLATNIYAHEYIDDVSNDDEDDVVVLLNQNFEEQDKYYVALSLRYDKGFYGTEAFYLGENIKPVIEDVVGNYIILSDENNQNAYRYFIWNEGGLKEVFFEHELIKLTKPIAAGRLSSPLEVEGVARGYWYFEANFPVILTDWDGLIIAEGVAVAQDEWMTEDFVPFKANLTFKKPRTYNRGHLILQKANPSGIANKDDAFEVPIFFE